MLGPSSSDPKRSRHVYTFFSEGTCARHGRARTEEDCPGRAGEQDVIAIAMVYVSPMRCGTGKRLQLFPKAPRQKKSNVYRDSEAGPVKA